MGGIWMAARGCLRRQWLASLLLVVVLGLVGGCAMGAIAGARRAHSAVARFDVWARVPTASVGVEDPSASLPMDAIDRLPQVVASQRGTRLLMGVQSVDGRRVADDSTSVLARIGTSEAPAEQRMLVLAGHDADRNDPAAVLINEASAAHLHAQPGTKLRLFSYRPDQIEALFSGQDVRPAGPLVDVRVVGIVRSATDLTVAQASEGVVYRGADTMYLTPAAYRTLRGDVADFGPSMSVRLAAGRADLDAFVAAVDRMHARSAFVVGDVDEASIGREAQRATRLESLALWALGLALALALAVLGVQALSRQVARDAEATQTLRSLGMAPNRTAVAVSLRAALVAIGVAVASVLVAMAFSTQMPIGLSRRAETAPGLSVDPWVLVPAAVLIALLLAGSAIFTGQRLVRHREDPGGRARPGLGVLADRAAAFGWPIVAVTGLRFAFDLGQGRTRATARQAFATGIIGVTAVTGTLVFAANLNHFVTTPVEQGWVWDVALGNPHGNDLTATGTKALRANPGIGAIVSFGDIDSSVGGEATTLIATRAVRGSIGFPYRRGRAPVGPGEVALGRKLLRHEHLDLGDSVRIDGPRGHARLRVVGEVLISPLIANDQIPLGGGGVVAPAAAERLDRQHAYNQFLVRFRPGAGEATTMVALRRDFPGAVLVATRPSDVENLLRVRSLPVLLAVLLAVGALGTIVHHLVTATLRRRRDLAVLRSIGFLRSQVVRTILWQSSVTIGVALLVGLPMGVALGRVGWNRLADDLGVVAVPRVPLLAVGGLVVGALATAALIAAAPGVRAARVPAATVLNRE